MPSVDTAIGSAFHRAGFNTARFRLLQAAHDALAKHHNNIDRALPTFKKLIGYAGDNELLVEALKFVLRDLADPQIDRGGADQAPRATHIQSVRPDRDAVHVSEHTRSPPAREPSAAQKAAAAAVAQSIAMTIHDRLRVRDGRAIGDVRFGEVERLRSTDARWASFLRQIQRHTTANHDQRLRDVIKPADLERMWELAAEVADAA